MKNIYFRITLLLSLIIFNLSAYPATVDRFIDDYGLVTVSNTTNGWSKDVEMGFRFDTYYKTATLYIGIKEDIINNTSSDGKLLGVGTSIFPFNKISIPSTVRYKSEQYTVTSVGFTRIRYSNFKFLEFKDNNSIKSIESNAFGSCHLEYVNFNRSPKLERIDDSAFWGNGQLVIIDGELPALREIGSYAFADCIRLAQLPDISNVRVIGSHAFGACWLLEELHLNNIENIYAYAFSDCESLSLDMRGTPRELKLAENAFARFNGKNIYFNNTNMVYINTKAFADCYAENVYFNESKVIIIEKEAFKNSTCNVDFTDCLNLEEFGESSFEGGAGNVIFPIQDQTSYSIARITFKDKAFYNNTGLKVVDTNCIKKIGRYCFASSSLQKFKVTSRSAVTIDPTAFSDCKDLEYFGVISVSFKTLPEGLLSNTPNLKEIDLPYVQNISAQAFAGSGIEKIDISSSRGTPYLDYPIEKIEDEVFLSSKLRCINLSKAKLNLGTNIFKNCNYLDSIDLSYCSGTEITDPTFFKFKYINLIGANLKKVTLHDGFEHLNLPSASYYDNDGKRIKPGAYNFELALPDDEIRTKSVVVEGGRTSNGVPPLIADEKSIANWNKNKLPAYLVVDDNYVEEFQNSPNYPECFTILPVSQAEPTLVSLSEQEKTLKMGENFILTCNYQDMGILTSAFEWKIDNPDIASIELMPDDDKSILVKGLKTGEAIVTCSLKDRTKQSLTCKIHVNTLTMDDIPVLKLEFEEDLVYVPFGIPYQLKVKVTPENHTETLKWDHTNKSSYGVKIDQNGFVTAEYRGDDTVIVSSANCTASCDVKGEDTVLEFSLNCDETITIQRNDVVTLKVLSTIPEFLFEESEFQWMAIGKEIQVFNDPAEDGKFYMKEITFKGVKVGDAIIRVACLNGWRNKGITIHVIEENVRSFELSDNDVEVFLNDSYTLSVNNVNPEDFKNPKFSWTPNNSNIEITNISKDTKSISFVAKELGECEIIARSLDNDTIFSSCRINILEKTVHDFKLSSDRITLNENETAEIKVIDIRPDIFKDSKFEWYADNSNAEITEISEDTQTITIEGKTEGSAVITAKSLENPEIIATCRVIVNHVYVEPRMEGDINEDGTVNIADVVLIIKYILSPEEFDEYPDYMDLNGDDKINISDVTKLVTLIMSQQSTRSFTIEQPINLGLDGHLKYGEIEFPTSQCLEIPVNLESFNDFVALQADLVTDGNVDIEDIISSNSHIIKWNRISENKVRLIMFSLTNEVISKDGAAFSLKIRNLSNIRGGISLINVIGVDKNARVYSLDSENLTLNPALIDYNKNKVISIVNQDNIIYIYNAEGQTVNIYSVNGITVRSFVAFSKMEEIKLTPGIYIIKIKDFIQKIDIR